MSSLNGASAVRSVGGRPTVVNNPEHANSRFPIALGIELELEGVQSHRDEDGNYCYPNVRGWVQHRDESLRGGVEYVLDGAKSGEPLEKAIAAFFASNVEYHNSARCSTHVHVNAGDLTIGQVRTILAISYMLEDALFTSLSAGRKWCGYCMPLTEMSPSRMNDLLNSTRTSEFSRGLGQQNSDKYYGINVRSLQRHGTLEFRYFPGVSSQRELLEWMDYCTLIYQAGINSSLEELSNINDIYDAENWLRTYMGKWAARLWKDTDREYMVTCIQEVLGMVKDSTGPERKEPLIFASKPAIAWAQKNMTEEQAKWFENSVLALKVMSFNDWNGLERQARTMKDEPVSTVPDGVMVADQFDAFYVPTMPMPPRRRNVPLDTQAAQVELQQDALARFREYAAIAYPRRNGDNL